LLVAKISGGKNETKNNNNHPAVNGSINTEC
jgi:hypothetical protein